MVKWLIKWLIKGRFLGCVVSECGVVRLGFCPFDALEIHIARNRENRSERISSLRLSRLGVIYFFFPVKTIFFCFSREKAVFTNDWLIKSLVDKVFALGLTDGTSVCVENDRCIV